MPLHEQQPVQQPANLEQPEVFTFKLQNIDPNLPMTPAEYMLPNPHVEDAGYYKALLPDASRKDHAKILNSENILIQQGFDPSKLLLSGSVLSSARHARNATSDKLTGLLNSAGIEVWFERFQPEKFAVFFADGDEFGKVNKDHGFEMGNRVIAHIGREIANKFRIREQPVPSERRKNAGARDAIAKYEEPGIGRLGGDEFMIVVDLTGVEDGEEQQVIDNMTDRLNGFGTYHDAETGKDISIGITAVSTLGRASNGKTLTDYKEELSMPLANIKMDTQAPDQQASSSSPTNSPQLQALIERIETLLPNSQERSVTSVELYLDGSADERLMITGLRYPSGNLGQVRFDYRASRGSRLIDLDMDAGTMQGFDMGPQVDASAVERHSLTVPETSVWLDGLIARGSVQKM